VHVTLTAAGQELIEQGTAAFAALNVAGGDKRSYRQHRLTSGPASQIIWICARPALIDLWPVSAPNDAALSIE
jgi:hypothetical protein